MVIVDDTFRLRMEGFVFNEFLVYKSLTVAI